MSYQVRWSKIAKESYLEILLYLQETWGDDKAVEFAEELEKIITSISKRPFMFPAAPHRLALRRVSEDA